MSWGAANIALPGQFNPKTDRWCDYKEQLLCALHVIGVCDSNLEKARSLFLSQCGKEMYSLIASLLVPERPTNVDFNNIMPALDKFYEPDVNEILEAGKFHRRGQLQDESIQEFVAAISLLGAKCKFMDLKRQLRDRLVLEVRDDRLRRELLKTKDLMYENAVQMCLNHQAPVQELYPSTSELKQNSSSATEPMDIGRITIKGTLKPIMVELDINGTKHVMELDSGASRTIISEEAFWKLWSVAPPLYPTNIKLVTWTRDTLKVLGVAHVQVKLGNKEAQCELIVVAGSGPSL
ncbi:uncharacterized protein [Epargyreus clarus]|uniref:uncharacterized protein n=1 Tax=Epargyreus clarus TaxID=520877 RepID=UPI003C2C19AE